MRESDIKGLGTKDIKALKEPKYPQNKIYRTAYVEGLGKHEETINKRIQELDVLIASSKGAQKTRAEAEKIVKNDELKKIEALFNKLKEEKKRIKKLLK
jgi:alpha-N-acetylglucosamine transferase